MKNFLLIFMGAALAGSAVFYFTYDDSAGEQGARGSGRFGAQPPPLVGVTPVVAQQLYDTVNAIGTAQANESLTLTAKVTDTITHVAFEDGDFVAAGAVLVELTNQEEEALLDEARANLDDALNQLRRLEGLAERGLAPESELDIARARAAASEARLNTVLARLRDRLIMAPFAGVLGFRQVSTGTLVQPNTPITTLDDISIIKLDFTVPETFLGVMTPGAGVFAESASYPGREFEGVVRTVGSRVDPVTRAFQVRAHIPNADNALRPGMLLTVRVVMGQRTALVIPEHAVFQIQDRAFVYRLDSELVAREQQIVTGARRVGLVEVVDGLEAGDRIVTEGIVKLRDGMRVRLAGQDAELSGLPDGAVAQPAVAGG
ncbi:MAG: efflux RND transporter periplasmic adaptor subunit [Alphaproteobacteria bacterium]|nr:efflux RND transporter periplasmic adaptor subunit [Alphaproteobacteria bacterium]